jgi:hypothetical protein
MTPDVIIERKHSFYGEMRLASYIAVCQACIAIGQMPGDMRQRNVSMPESYTAFQSACRAGIVFW